MKQETLMSRLQDRGYSVIIVEDGMDVYDTFGWRAFISDKIRLGVNTCNIELPNEDYNIINRYIRTPLKER